MTMVRFARLRDEEGFTLIELLIGIVITGLLFGVIAGALIVGLKTTDATSQRFSESHDAQVTSAYLANDVQSAASVAVSSGSATCGTMGTPTNLVNFTYAGGQIAAYSCGTVNGETRVTRSFTGSNDVVVAHFAGAARPNVTCPSSPCTSTPNVVKISFIEASGYAFSLLGTRRLSTGAPADGVVSPRLTLLAFGSSPLWIAGGCNHGQIVSGTCIDDPDTPDTTDNPSLTVNGNLYVNSTLSNAVKLTGKKSMKLTITNGGDFKIQTPGGCTGCTPATVTCSACVWTGSRPWTGFSPALPDPLRFMADPVSSSPGSCSGGTPVVCQPGVYATELKLTRSATLNPGIYILTQGMSVTGNSTQLSGSGVMLFVRGGNLSFGGGSALSLSPPTTGTYKDILIFQSRSNSNALTINGGTSAILTFGGVIYAPASSQVTLSTGGANLNVTAVIAQNVKVAGGAQVTVG